MKRSVLLSAVICLLIGNPANAQKGLLKKVANSMSNELLGKPQNNDTNKPEPPCACDPADLVLDLGGKLQFDYSEINISSREDGALLLKDKISGNFYISKGGVTQGPMQAGDKRLAGFDEAPVSDENSDYWIIKYGQYIKKQGEKYVITYGGKNYGPYAMINSFVIPRSNDKFAALVVENIAVTENEGKKMDEAMKNAKSDQERMDLAMQYGQQMANKMMQNGGAQGVLPKFITSVEGATYDPMQMTGTLNANMKYDDILVSTPDGIYDLKGNKLLTIKPEHLYGGTVFINTANSGYAFLNFGELSFSYNNTKIAEFFNPSLMKADGKVYITYMYYSPRKNSILQCKLPF